MYGISPEFDPAAFSGALLDEVRVEPGIVRFGFSASEITSVFVEGAYELAGPAATGVLTALGRRPSHGGQLRALTGHRVVEAVVHGRERLILNFDDGHSLTLIDDLGQYECFQVWQDGKPWIM